MTICLGLCFPLSWVHVQAWKDWVVFCIKVKGMGLSLSQEFVHEFQPVWGLNTGGLVRQGSKTLTVWSLVAESQPEGSRVLGFRAGFLRHDQLFPSHVQSLNVPREQESFLAGKRINEDTWETSETLKRHLG